jgi:hypothetical protein
MKQNGGSGGGGGGSSSSSKNRHSMRHIVKIKKCIQSFGGESWTEVATSKSGRGWKNKGRVPNLGRFIVKVTEGIR